MSGSSVRRLRKLSPAILELSATTPEAPREPSTSNLTQKISLSRSSIRLVRGGRRWFAEIPLLRLPLRCNVSIVADPAKRRASYADVLAVPPGQIAQVLDGVLEVHPRPPAVHALAASALGEELGPPFKRGRGGPGGWVILDEPELHLRDDILVPDLAGWRRERMPETPLDAYFTLAPDWICEVLSPSTYAMDRSRKLPIYAREGVLHAWLVEPSARVLEVLRLEGDTYRIVATYEGEAQIHAEPFDAIQLDLGILWAR